MKIQLISQNEKFYGGSAYLLTVYTVNKRNVHMLTNENYFLKVSYRVPWMPQSFIYEVMQELDINDFVNDIDS